MFEYFWTFFVFHLFFFKSAKIHMIIAETAESKEKSNLFSDFYFSSYGHFWLFLSLIFDEFFTMTQIIKNRVKTDEWGGGWSAHP